MGATKQILLIKSSKTKKEIRYELENYKFDLNNKVIRQTLLESLSKKYEQPFDIVCELKNNN